ncbi:MAG: hypothetical protein JRI97_01850 [Deltaproteobacteria bacterium]|nr:hypothetical protein [Deltaproteobacteria bacterium]
MGNEEHRLDRAAEAVIRLAAEPGGGSEFWEPVCALTGADTPEDAARLLADPDCPGAQAAWELVLYPGPEIMARVERLWEEHGLQPEDGPRVRERIVEGLCEVRLPLPGGRTAVLSPPREAGEAFAQRLRLSVLDPALAEAFEEMEEQQRLACRAAARGLALEGEALRFLGRLARAFSGEPDVSELFAFAAGVLKDAPPGADPAPVLADYARWCQNALFRADADDARTRGMNMETRVALGIRPPYVDRTRMEKRLDRCARILAKTAPGLWPPPLEEEVHSVIPDSPDSLKTFIRGGLREE